MNSFSALDFYKRLQHIILDSEENADLLNLLLPKVVSELATYNLYYEEVIAYFLDENLKIKKAFFSKENIDFNFESFFVPGSNIEKELLWGHATVLALQNGSIIFSPIIIKGKLSAIVVFKTLRPSFQINIDELSILETVSNLIGMSFKLQDSKTSLIHITQEIYKMNAKLHQLDRLKDDFVSIASHELRTPMTAIRSYVWMAMYKSDIPLSEKLKRYLNRTLISTERLINLVNDMLNVSRIESGSIEISPKPFDMVALVKDVFEEVKLKAQEKNINLSLMEHPIPFVFADSDKVHEVLLNLIGNSIKFSFPGGYITVGFFLTEQMLEVSIGDSGPGISKEDLGKLFSKFGRLDNSYTGVSSATGTGLGLFISKSLVELMHGKIWANSQGINKGATFSFSLPLSTKEVLEDAEKYQVKPLGQAKTLEPVAI